MSGICSCGRPNSSHFSAECPPKKLDRERATMTPRQKRLIELIDETEYLELKLVAHRDELEKLTREEFRMQVPEFENEQYPWNSLAYMSFKMNLRNQIVNREETKRSEILSKVEM